jgi:N-acetylglucosamine-6-phosphate deacetylase
MASKYPARLMGLEDVGEIAVGKKADLLVLSPELALQHVFVHGLEQLARNN